MTSGLTVRDDGAVRWLILDRPEIANAVNRAMQRELVEQLGSISADHAVRAVVLTASGSRHFCTGPDLSDPELSPSRDRVAGDASRILRNGSQAVVAALLDCEKPVICALNGVAAGVGSSMALACDLIIAARSARLITLFVRRGLIPDGGASYLLARKFPLNVAKELVFFGDDLSVSDAHRLGVVNKVVDDEELESETTAWAQRLAEGPTRAHAAAKAMLNRALDGDRAAAFATEALLVEQIAATDDVAEGVAAFVERRPPQFRGR
ncbi:2-(1,2-epoxy-1,2-dihydrophenyl)acetyl-CoA isomerase [Mycobacterium paraintracellulare]|uniref:enoyl-CoA hydratase/isomerase family protein n=1 Tax=Mycobacterium avium complex (MAC) TaxID=120793 RepID=UPI0019159F77|nr:enoyl-CoA hydratase-related protein [Mycobacterium paraintracellulare]BCP08079.1 2-(1,2-epoxy-1,2-dihydrophenyl)acetyl-CoA isomerase [Mycobacterium paraintracellulare]